MKNLFTFWRNPNESNGSTSRGLNGGRTGVEATVKGRSTVHRALCIVNLLIALCFGFSSQAWAKGLNKEAHVYLTVGTTTKYYKIASGDWSTGATLPGTWGGNLWEQSFGVITTLKIAGGAVGGWTENGESLNGSLYYKVYKEGSSEPSSWTNFGSITSSSVYSDKNCFYYKNNGSTSIFPTEAGKYCLKVKVESEYTTLGGGDPAKFTVNPIVTFDANGGSGSMSAQTVTYNTSTKLNSNQFTAPTGYSFNGWNTTADGTGTSYSNSGNITATAHTTLYAQWKAKNITFTLEKNGGSCSYGSTSKDYDAVLSKLNNGYLPTKEGYDFQGYYTSDGTSSGDWGSQLVDPSGNWQVVSGYTEQSGDNIINKKSSGCTIYAKWAVHSYSIIYKDGGNKTFSGTSWSETGSHPATYTIETATITLASPAKVGYSFGGWFSDASCTEENEITEITVGSTGDKNLYAKWTANTTNVTLDMNGGDNANQSFSVNFDASIADAITAAENADPATIVKADVTKTGYTFKGFYNQTSGGNGIIKGDWTIISSAVDGWTSSSKAWKNPNSNATLFAQWTAKTYEITFDPNGGTSQSFTKTFTYNQKPVASLDIPTHATDNFAGYGINSAEGTLLYNAAGQLIYPVSDYTDNDGKWIYDGTITLVAKWISNYIITLDGDGATTPGTTSVDVSPATTILTSIDEIPQKTGNTFNGYFTAKNGEGTQLINADGTWKRPVPDYIDNDGKWILGRNITLYAKWDANKTTVSFDKQEGAGGANQVTLTYNSVTNMGNISCPTREGYTFAGYYTEAEGAGAQLITDAGAWIANVSGYTGEMSNEKPRWMKPTAGELTLYAKWTENIFDLTVIRRYLDLNGDAITAQDVQEQYTHEIGIATSKTIDAFEVQTGYFKEKWRVAAGANVKCGQTTTDASSEEKDITGSTDKTSIELTGWRNDNNAITIYDRWKENARNVTVSAVNGTIQDAISQVTVGVYTPQTVTAIANTGYDFVNWTTNPASSSYEINLSASSSLTTEVRVTSSVKTDNTNAGSITANFTAHPYSIAYANMEGATNFDDAPENYTIESETIVLGTPSKAGYTFTGWKKTDASGADITEIAQGSHEDITLWATWSLDTYHITYANMEGATNFNNAPETYTVTTNTITLGTPSKIGFAFVNWTENDAAGAPITQIVKGSIGDKTLYANWATTNVYVECRFRVRDNYKENGGNFIYVNTAEDESALSNSTNIQFQFDDQKKAYLLNTYSTFDELAKPYKNEVPYFHIATSTDGTNFTQYSYSSNTNFEFNSSVTNGTIQQLASPWNFYFKQNSSLASAGPVALMYDPVNNNLSYCVPTVAITYDGENSAKAIMTKVVDIDPAKVVCTPTGLTNPSYVIQYSTDQENWNNDWTAFTPEEEGTYYIRVCASGTNEFGMNVANVYSNVVTVTVTQPQISARITKVNGEEENIVRVNDEITITPTVTGVPSGQQVQICYHFATKPAGSSITTDVFTHNDDGSVNTNVDIEGDYTINVSISNVACEETDPIVWQTYQLNFHVKGDEINVYARLERSIDWEGHNVYWYKGDDHAGSGAWPGKPMTYIGKDSLDYAWYKEIITDYKRYKGGYMVFNDATSTYGLQQTVNVDMPEDDAFYFIKATPEGGKRTIETLETIDVTPRVILTTDTTALYQYITIAISGKAVFFVGEDIEYTYTLSNMPGSSVSALNSKHEFTPDVEGEYTITIQATCGQETVTNEFVLNVLPNPLTLVASGNQSIGSKVTLTVSTDGANINAYKKTWTTIEPGSTDPVTFSSGNTSNTNNDYTTLSSGTYTFQVVLTDGDGKITGKKTVEYTVSAKKMYIKHQFKQNPTGDNDGWSWKEMTYDENTGTYSYYENNSSYFHKGKVANINVEATDITGDKGINITNPDNLADNSLALFVYDPAAGTVTVYSTSAQYRVKSESEYGTFYSNAINAANEQISFFAAKDGQLSWQTYTAGGSWADIAGSQITTAIPANGIYTATPTLQQADFAVTEYTNDLYVHTALVTDPGSNPGHPTAENGKMTKFTKVSTSEYYNYYWVRFCNQGKQAQATIGNSINGNLSTVLPYYELPQDANVRYAYDNTTNHFERTFLLASSESDFLKIYGESLFDTDGETAFNTLSAAKKFNDGSDWIYTVSTVGKVSSTQSVTAKLVTNYNGASRWILAKSGLEADPEATMVVLDKNVSSPATYELRVNYDYKTNRLIAGWQPEDNTEFHDSILIDRMIISRNGDNSATRINVFDKANIVVVDKMTTEMVIAKDDWDNMWNKNDNKYMYYWLSLPYACNISEIYGLGIYGEKFEVQRYRGDLRALGQAGGNTGTSAWRRLKETATMEANRGYVIAFEVTDGDFKSADGVSAIRLFFPSAGKVELGHSATTTLPENEDNATSNLHWNWYIMGNPILTTNTGSEMVEPADWDNELNYVYEWSWNGGEKTYQPASLQDVTLKATHSYMVQAKGNLKWTYPASTQSAPARYLEAAHYATEANYGKLDLRLNLTENGELADKTYIMYRPNGTRDYEMGRDLEKIINAGHSQLYSSLSQDLASICLADDDEVMIPLTIVAAKNGTYTISLNKQLNANLEPTIYDSETGRYTNLNMADVVLEINQGTSTGRYFFLLRRAGVVTNLNELNNNRYDGGVHKFIRNNRMFILRERKLYDAIGAQLR